MKIERQPEPEAVTQFREAGGVVDYSIFGGVSDDRAALREAVQSHFSELPNLPPVWRPWLKIDVLDALPSRPLSKDRFFGDWYDPESGSLILRGRGNLKGKGRVSDPLYIDLKGCRLDYWGGPGHQDGDEGQYAYAFSQPPHHLGVGFFETQTLFATINDLILPPSLGHRITDWSSLELGRLSNYFDAGLEWWGAFLFAIHVPQIGQLTIISASTTD